MNDQPQSDFTSDDSDAEADADLLTTADTFFISGYPTEVRAELQAADEAYTRAFTRLLLAATGSGSLPAEAAMGWGKATAQLPCSSTHGEPLELTIEPVAFYVVPGPDAGGTHGWTCVGIPRLGPNSALLRALDEMGGQLRPREIYRERLISPRWWLNQLEAAPPEEQRDHYPLTPRKVRQQFRDLGRTPPTGRSLSNYAQRGLLPYGRDEAWEGEGLGHRRYPSDTVTRIQAIADLTGWGGLSLEAIAELVDRRRWYNVEDQPPRD